MNNTIDLFYYSNQQKLNEDWSNYHHPRYSTVMLLGNAHRLSSKGQSQKLQSSKFLSLHQTVDSISWTIF